VRSNRKRIDIALAQQIKAHAPNAKLLLDFQYSDTWPIWTPNQPAAWASLTFAQLQSTVQTYTQNTLLAFQRRWRDAGHGAGWK